MEITAQQLEGRARGLWVSTASRSSRSSPTTDRPTGSAPRSCLRWAPARPTCATSSATRGTGADGCRSTTASTRASFPLHRGCSSGFVHGEVRLGTAEGPRADADRGDALRRAAAARQHAVRAPARGSQGPGPALRGRRVQRRRGRRTRRLPGRQGRPQDHWQELLRRRARARAGRRAVPEAQRPHHLKGDSRCHWYSSWIKRGRTSSRTRPTPSSRRS